MEYKGKLFGKAGNKYFPIGKTTDDFDKIEKKASAFKLRIKYLSEKYEELKDKYLKADFESQKGFPCKNCNCTRCIMNR
jgi:hypothetical protein